MPSPIYIGEWKLREIFNRSILPRIEAGELQEYIEDQGPAHPKYRQEPGARSQMVTYYESGKAEGKILGEKVAIVHRYLNPDGSIGASGMPDPKSIKHEGQIYFGKRPKGAQRGKEETQKG
jgi:hypothetical protein